MKDPWLLLEVLDERDVVNSSYDACMDTMVFCFFAASPMRVLVSFSLILTSAVSIFFLL